MKKYLILLAIFSLILLSACGAKQTKPEISINNANANEPAKEIVTISNEIPKPDFILPADINSAQIIKYFMKDDVYYALVLQPSMNITLTLPPNFKTTFVGVLKAAKGDKSWNKFIEINDVKPADKNNPYYLWITKNQIRLTVVDQNGAGSGEGLLKLFKIENNQASLIGCYYYPASGPAKQYYSDTKNLSQFEAKPMATCNNVQISIIK